MASGTENADGPGLLDAVALLAAKPGEGLRRGEVGTLVEQLDDDSVLVEFSDVAIVPCRRSELLVLHTVPPAA